MSDNERAAKSRLSNRLARMLRKRKSRKKPQRRTLQMESLEDRRVLATAQLSIFVDSVEQTIPANIGVDSGGTFLSQTRTLSSDGTVTIDPIASEAVTNNTLGDFFDTWRTNAGAAGNNANATFDFDTVLGNNANQTNTVQMFVNGEVNREYEDYVFQDNDQIILVYGPNPVISLNTNHGPIVMELFSDEVSSTVDNFLNYVNDGDFDTSIFHRLDPGFVLQGGDQVTTSETFTDPSQLSQIPSDPAVQNEFNRSNTRGTVAMARQGGVVNSATNNFFVNLADTNTFLDTVDEGFTVFAQVLDMTTVDFVENFNLSQAIPNATGSGLPLDDNDQLVVIRSVEGQGAIRGTKFTDIDGDGTQDTGENGVAGARVFADANGNSTFDVGEAFTLTDANGDYTLLTTAGSQTIRTDTPSGSTLTGPAGGSFTVAVTIGSEATGNDFGEVLNTVINDDTVQGVGAGTTINVDVLANDQVATAATGSLAITGVTQGSGGGTVVINGSSITYTSPANFTGTETFTYTAEDSLGTSQTATVTSTAAQGEISGFVYVDGDGDSTKDTGEAGVPSVLVTLTGTTSTGQGVTRTFMTLADGSYKFDELPIGTYSVAERQPAALADGGDSSDASGASVGNDNISNLVIAGAEMLTGNNFGEGSLASQYVSIHNFIVRNTSETAAAALFVERMAMAEEDAGNFDFAAEVRAGATGEQSTNTGVVAPNKTYDATEDETLTVTASNGLLAGVTDPDGDTLTPTIVSFAANGTVTVQTDGSFTYVPSTDFVGADSFVYRISDGSHDSNDATVTINVASANVAPVAVDDSGAAFTTDEDVTLTTTTSVLANDTDANSGDTLTARLLTQPVTGTLTLNSDGTFTYVPVADASGTVTFTYEAFDGTLASAPATVSITINSVNDAPVADNESVGPVDEDMPLTINVADLLSGDTDVDGDTVSFDSANLGTPTNGTVADNNDGTLTYTPDNDFNGTDTFTYAITDGNGGTATGTVTVTVTAVNDAPVAGDDSLNVDEDTPLTITIATDLLAGAGADTDVDGDAVSFVPGSLTTASSGTLINNNDGTLTYTPVADSTADVTFQYAVTDGTLQSNLATVTITINPINDAPIANDDTLNGTEDTPLVINAANDLVNGTGVDTDVDGDSLSVVDLPTVDVGMVVDNQDGTFTYTPPDDFFGIATLSYFVNDSTTNSATAADVTITIASVDDTPVANDGEFTTPVNSVAAMGAVSFSDVDTATGSLTVVADDTGLTGTLTMQANGDFTYTPANGFHNSETFTFTVTDGNTTSPAATVTIFVNSLPVPADDSLSVDEDNPLTINVQDDLINGPGLDTDADGDTLILVLASQVDQGMLVDNMDGTFTYTPDSNFNGDATFTYTVNDGLQDSATNATVTITVNAVNDAPAANDDAFLIDQDEVLTINVVDDLINGTGVDTDVEGDTLSFVSFTNPSSGAIIDNTGVDGTLEFTPANGFSGDVTFTYIINDGTDDSAPATVTISVNAPPVPADDALSVDEDNTLVINVLDDLINGNGQDTDGDGDTIALTSFTQPMSGGQTAGTLADNNDGTLSYVPSADFNGDATFTYIINDGKQDSASSATVTITVNAVNDAPVANDDALATDEDMQLTINIQNDLLGGTGADTDADAGDTLTFVDASLGSPSSGMLVNNNDGTLTFTPATDATDDVTFTYVINDGTVNSAPATVTISINPINDAPVAVDDTLTVAEDTSATFSIVDDLINGSGQDTDVEGTTPIFVAFGAVSSGTLDHTNGADAFTFTPDLNSTADVTFTYTISDGLLTSAPATVTINVTAANDAPVAVDDALTTAEDASLQINVLNELINGSGQDTDAEGDTLSFVSFDNLSSGTMTGPASGILTFTPVADFNGDVTFTYIINDGQLDSAPATATITVTAVNDAPVANDDTLTSTNFQTAKQITVATDLLANDTDVDDTPTFSGFTSGNVADGTVTANQDNTVLTFTPAAGFSGDYTFTYQVTDGSLTSAPATVTIPVRDENDFEIAENSPEDTVVGTVTTSGNFAGNVVYEIESATVPEELQIRADDHTSGNPEAKAVLLEFLDFQ